MAKTTKKKPNRRDLTERNLDAQKKVNADLRRRVLAIENSSVEHWRGHGLRLEHLEAQARNILSDLQQLKEQQQAMMAAGAVGQPLEGLIGLP